MKRIIGTFLLIAIGVTFSTSLNAQTTSNPGYIGKIVTVDKDMEGSCQSVVFSVERVGTAPRERVDRVYVKNLDTDDGKEQCYSDPDKDRDEGKTLYQIDLVGVDNPKEFQLTIYMKPKKSILEVLGIRLLSATSAIAQNPEDPEGTVIVLKYP